MREAKLERKTNETDIIIRIDLDGSGLYDIDTGCGFLNHMLELFTRHGNFDIDLRCKGDTEVDDHHTVEDVGIVLGQAMLAALGDKRGINRYGSVTLPMDEALIVAAVDLSGRAALGYALEVPTVKIGNFDTELVREFMEAMSRNLGAAIHVRQLAGLNSHHIIEGAFKALARALREAVALDERNSGRLPTTKGSL